MSPKARGQVLLGITGIAKLLNIQPTTVRKYREQGRLPDPEVFIDGKAAGWSEAQIREWHSRRPVAALRRTL